MSHIVNIETQVRDIGAINAACQRLGLPLPREETVSLFSGVVTGLAVHLQGWRFPIVCDLSSGVLSYDNYGGAWGDPSELDQFLQMYAVERTRIEARRHGHTVQEQALEDGSIKLIVQMGGAA